MIAGCAGSDPNAIAVDDGSRRRSWRELADRSTRVCHFLRDELGLRPGQHAAILMGNRTEYLELFLGGIQAGLWVTPINGHLSADEIAYIVEDSGAGVVFADDLHAETARTSGAPVVALLGDQLETALAGASDAPVSPDAPAGGPMIYTSGTTGRPKGVKRTLPDTLAAYWEYGRRSGCAVGLDGSGPHLVTGPLYHAAPLMFAIYDQMNGANVIILPRFNERETLGWIREREIAHTHLVPTMFVRLLRLSEEERAAFAAPRLELVLHGAAPVSVAVKKRMIEWWGPVLVEYWGATEGGVNTLIDSEDWLAHPGSVGRALPAFDVFAVDGEGARLPAGEIGPLYCRDSRGDRVFEYHGAPE
ncbi:MAG: AMP-binding protein, partial [Proteobacteria bacterium]|nr:AMP-binding protein [Pseudomonadota bacterium]